MTLASAGQNPDEELLIGEAQTTFAGFFRWVGVLNEMIQTEIGPKFGLVVNNAEIDLAESKISATLDASRPLKAALSIPFSIKGDCINLAHEKFEILDTATGAKSADFSSARIGEVNRILSDVVQDYIG